MTSQETQGLLTEIGRAFDAAFRLDVPRSEFLARVLALLEERGIPPQTDEEDKAARVDHSQYDRPLATAPQNKPVPHTPGPWRAVSGDDDPQYGEVEFACVEHPRYDAIEICTSRYGATVEEHFANARLIAAAPDLLAALSQIVRAVKYTSGVSLDFAVQEAEAAIAKVEGANQLPLTVSR